MITLFYAQSTSMRFSESLLVLLMLSYSIENLLSLSFYLRLWNMVIESWARLITGKSISIAPCNKNISRSWISKFDLAMLSYCLYSSFSNLFCFFTYFCLFYWNCSYIKSMLLGVFLWYKNFISLIFSLVLVSEIFLKNFLNCSSSMVKGSKWLK